MENSFLDDFFHTTSKLIIFFPILVVVGALFFKFNQTIPAKQPSVAPTPIIYISPTFKLNLDLNKPAFCQYSSKQSAVTAFIKKKLVFATRVVGNKETDYLLKGDCLYFWEKGQYSGEKMCGLSSYLTLIDVMPQFDLSLLPKFIKSDIFSAHWVEIQNVIKSCKKKEIKDQSIFNLPENVLFKNK